MMIPVPVVIGAAVVMAVLILLLVRRGGGGRGQDLMTAPRPMQPRIPVAGLPPQVETEVRALIAEQRMIEAIKRVREETGLGLKEAKDLVESIDPD